MNPYYFAFSHAISPSGELVATITFNALASDMDIVLLSAKDGRILKNITKGATTDYQYISYDIDPSNGPLPGLVAGRGPHRLLRPRRPAAQPLHPLARQRPRP